MERNTLVYALGEAAFVAHARYRQGGSWHGATDALRRRLTRVLVTASPWHGEAESARRSLLALGAQSIAEASPESVSDALEAVPLQPWLPTFAPDSSAERALGTF
jgi:predicted Rossmann fold nucleotide-binding protein DprA/Smf involved in DNA uptake